jgi:3-amino-5-hydroxybenzoic acid synthesis related protein
MLKAVIFDFDGVLINSEPLMRFAFDKCYREVIGVGEPPTESYLDHMGESFPQIMKHLGLPISLWEPYKKICQENLHLITLFAEARTLLSKLQGEVKLALLTGKDRARTLQTLEHFDLRQFFESVVASDQLRFPKPHPEGIHRTLDMLQVKPGQAVMIGDSVSDVQCAQQAGVISIAVTWGIKPERVQTLCNPDYLVHDWGALGQVLTELRAGKDAPSLLARLNGGGRA